MSKDIDKNEYDTKKDTQTNENKKQPIREEKGTNIRGIAKWAGILLVGAILVLGIFALGDGKLTNIQTDKTPDKEIELAEFEDMHQLDVVIVDQGVLSQNESLQAFVDEYKGQLGLHVYIDEETEETFGLISGEKGMEPLTVMLYGLVEAGNNEVIIGYNFVEASPQFQDEIPTMLIRVEGKEDAKVSGRLVNNEDFEDYESILERYENAGDENITDDLTEEEITESAAEDVNNSGKDELEVDEEDTQSEETTKAPIIINNKERETEESETE